MFHSFIYVSVFSFPSPSARPVTEMFEICGVAAQN